MSASRNHNESAKIINGVNIQAGGTLSKVIQNVWRKNAEGISESLGSAKKGIPRRLSSIKKDDKMSLNQDDHLSNTSDSFTSNFDEVFDSATPEISEKFEHSHPFKMSTESNPYIERINIHTPGKNPFLSGSSYSQMTEKIVDITVIPKSDTPDNRGSQMLKENEVPLTPLRACRPRTNSRACPLGRTPSIKLHTPEQSGCIALAHSRPYQLQDQHPMDSPLPMPRTNPNCARFISREGSTDGRPGTPFRYPSSVDHGDDDDDSSNVSPRRIKPQQSVRCRTDTDAGSLYHVMVNGAQVYTQNDYESKGPSEGTEAPESSLEKSFNLVDTSPSENFMNLQNTPVDLSSVFAGSNTPKCLENSKGVLADDLEVHNVKVLAVQYKDHPIEVTPTPTVCSSYQAHISSALSDRTGLNVSMARDSVSSCETHRLDLYQPPDLQEEKMYNLQLKIALGLIIFGSCMFIAAVVALIIEDPMDIM